MANIVFKGVIDKWDKAILETGFVSPYKPFKLVLYSDTQISAAKKVWGASWKEMVIDARDSNPSEASIRDFLADSPESEPLWDQI